MSVKPTPTQAELDAHMRGEHITEHEHDGSPYETIFNIPVDHENALTRDAKKKKAAEAEAARATYKTREVKAEEKK